MHTHWRARHAGLLVLLLACLLPFLAGIHGPFLHDDFANLKLTHVGAASWQSAWDVAFRNPSGPFGRPLANLSFATQYWWLGATPFHFKLVNLILHGACGLLVHALSLRLLTLLRIGRDDSERRLAALVAMAIWLIHPLQVSTVLYAVQRMAQLAALFTLLGCWWLVRCLQAPPRTMHTALLACTVFTGCLALGFAGKESAILLPLLGGVIVLFAAMRGALPPRSRPMRLFLVIVIGLPLFAGVLGFAATPHWIMDSYAGREFTMDQRLMTEATVLWFYMRLILLPWIPAMGLFHDDYPIFGVHDWQAWLGLVGWGLAVFAALKWRQRMPLAGFALAWFLAAHSLESTFLPLELVYEHRNYVALLGPALWAGQLAAMALCRYRVLLRVGWVIPLLLLFAATLTRSHQWSSGDLFAIHEYRHHPDSIRAGFAEAGRRVVTRDFDGAERIYLHIQKEADTRMPGRIWPLMLDALLQCRRAGHQVRWTEIQRRIDRSPTLDRTLEFSSAIMSQLMSGTCKPLQLEEFRNILGSAYRKSLERKDFVPAAMAASHLGWTGVANHQPALARLWLRRAADADPSDPEPLFDLAYQSLNNGEIDAAQALVGELHQRARQNGLPIDYRIDELQGYVHQERSKVRVK